MPMTTFPNGLRLNMLSYRSDIYTLSGKVAKTYRATALEQKQFRLAELALLREKPHLKAHKFCGICPDTEDRPTRRVVMPNGHVLHTTWYKVPTTEADAKRDFREQEWLCSKEGRDYYRSMFAAA